MYQRKKMFFYGVIIGVFYLALLYLDCFGNKSTDTNVLRYDMILIIFLETTFSLLGKENIKLWENCLWKLRLAVLIADFYFLFTPYAGAGIGSYMMVQYFYKKMRVQCHINEERNSTFFEFTMIVFLVVIGILGGDFALYTFGGIYAWLLVQNVKSTWNIVIQGKNEMYYLAVSLLFLACCDTSIFLYFLWDRRWIGNLIWFFYIPSQFLLAKYE